MKKLSLLLLTVAAVTLSAAKPVGLFYGNSWQQLGELLKATLFNPQWTHDKPAWKVVGKTRNLQTFLLWYIFMGTVIRLLSGNGQNLMFPPPKTM